MGKAKFAYTVWQWGTETEEQFIQALKDITEAGYEYFESVKATINVFNGDVSRFKSICEEYGAKPVGFYFHFNGNWDNDVEDVKKKFPFMAACGVNRMNLQSTGLVGRRATKEELDYNLRVINEIAKMAKDYGIVPCVHTHYNTTVMYEDEIEYILDNTDPEMVAFGPDTAHLTAGLCDPVKMIAKYAERVKFIHLKDITNEGLEVAGMQAGVEVYTNFRELGEGIVDFPSIFKILDDVGYDGYLTAELDRSRFGNKESAIMSMKYLKANYKQD
ncbi:MAG: sugar phosphate isomerase/epimerase [Clostridiaceae bacterium]|nr:sugar phosphate isomerase/epimerase [Clostridiaceae bacterium]